MRKYLLFIALLIVSHINSLSAQTLFVAPDTVCPKQAVQLKSNFPDAATHYWGFCSAYLLNKPVGNNMGSNKDSADDPSGIEIVKDGDLYYGFLLNRTSRTFIRYEFGNSFSNTPKITDYGNMDTVLPEYPNSLYVVKDTTDSTWHIFVVGGNNVFNSTLARLDFGKHFSNTPNIVNFGNLGGLLLNPSCLFISKEAGKWYGFAINRVAPVNKMIRIEFGSNISYTPTLVNLGIINGVTNATDLAAIKVLGLWYFFVTNDLGNFIFRLDMGSVLSTTTPTSVTPIGSLLGALNGPSGVSVIRDCDSIYAFITNRGNHSLIRMEMPSVTGPYTGVSYGNVAGFLNPECISSLVRDRDNLYAFAGNPTDSSISRIVFSQCVNSSIPYSTSNVPPPYFYDTAGTFNVYYAINEGQPDMQIQCKLITVLPTPPLFLSNDTVLCQGDTVALHIFSANALSYTWSPNYNITSTTAGNLKVYPAYSVNYHIVIPFPHNCLIDTNVKINVRKVRADAGPDRVLSDGASTILGGPLTTVGTRQQYLYTWSPSQYLSNPYDINPVATPTHDMTYYLYVTDTSTIPDHGNCVSIDTVVVHVDCNDINLPNAFMPGAPGSKGHFGLANSQIVKLNYFRIYNRWGMLVFDAGTDPQKDWDGTISGTTAPLGVFVWEADGFCTTGKRLQKSGNVTVIR